MKQPEESLSTKVQEARPFLRFAVAVLFYAGSESKGGEAVIREAFRVADLFLDQLVKDVEASE